MNWDGVLLLDKPSGMTSHDVVRELRRTLRWRAIGHAGTLDPLATGLLIILLGEATCLSSDFLNRDKRYRVKVRWGIETDTWDREGKVLREDSTPIERERALLEAQKLVGDLDLPIPIFSAVKRGGKKLYEYAREGRTDIEIPKRKMKFYNLVTTQVGGDWIELEMSCSKGSFIRSWAYELGLRLGVGGRVEELRRLSSDPYEVTRGVSLDEVAVKGLCLPHFIPLQDCFSSYKTLTLVGRGERLMKHGQIPRELLQRLIDSQKRVNQRGEVLPVRVLSGPEGRLLSLLELRPFKKPKVRKIFSESLQ